MRDLFLTPALAFKALIAMAFAATVLFLIFGLNLANAQVEGQDDVSVSCSGGGEVTAGSSQTFTCAIENDTGTNISWDVTTTGGVAYVSKTLSTADFAGRRTGTVNVTVNSAGTATVSVSDHEDSDSDSVSFTVSSTDPDPTATPTPTPTPTPRPPDPGDPPAPPKPTNVRATGGDRSVTVTWNSRRGIEEYEVQYRKSGTTTWISGAFVSGSSEEEGAEGTDSGDGTEDSEERDAEGEAGDLATLTGLDCGATYQFRVSGLGDDDRYADEWSPWSSTASATTNACVAPPKPTSLSATAADNSASLSWSAVSSGLTKFEIEYRESTATTWNKKSVAGGSARSDTVSGLTCEVTHVFRIRAHGDGTTYSSGWSSWSSTATATPTCALPDTPVPSGLKARASYTVDTDVYVQWTQDSAIVDYQIGYRVHGSNDTWSTKTVDGPAATSEEDRSGKASGSTEEGAEGQADNFTTITGLTTDTAYDFRIRAMGDGETYEAAWSNWSGTATATPGRPKVTVSAVTACVGPGTSAEFTFTADRTALRDLVVGLTFVEGGDVTPGTLPTSVTISEGSTTATLSLATHATNTGSVKVSAETGTYYRVGTTSSATVEVLLDLPVPAGFSVTSSKTLDDTVVVTWTEDQNITDYQIDYRVTGTQDWSTKTVDGPAGESGPEGTGGSGDDAEGRQNDITSITGLTADTSHDFRIRAMGDGLKYKADWGTWSSTQTAKPGRPKVSISAVAASVTPGAAAEFTFTADRTPQLDVAVSITVAQTGDVLSGTAPTSVTVSNGATSAPLSLATHASNTGSVTVTVGTGTYYRIDTSSSATVTVKGLPLVPAPENFTGSAGGSDSSTWADLSWTRVSGLGANYEIGHRLVGGEWLSYLFPSNNSRTISGQPCGTTYEYRIRAQGDGITYSTAWGPWSTANVTTASCGPAVRFENLPPDLYTKESRSFTVSASDLLASTTYTISVTASTSGDNGNGNDIGFDAACSDTSETLTVPASNTSYSTTLTLYACSSESGGGSVTAQLRSGTATVHDSDTGFVRVRPITVRASANELYLGLNDTATLTAEVDGPAGAAYTYRWERETSRNVWIQPVWGTTATEQVDFGSKGTRTFRVKVTYNGFTATSEPVRPTWDVWNVFFDMLALLERRVTGSTDYTTAETALLDCVERRTGTRPESFDAVLVQYTGTVKTAVDACEKDGAPAEAGTGGTPGKPALSPTAMFDTYHRVHKAKLDQLFTNQYQSYALLSTDGGEDFRRSAGSPEVLKLYALSASQEQQASGASSETGTGFQCIKPTAPSDLRLKLEALNCLVFKTDHSWWRTNSADLIGRIKDSTTWPQFAFLDTATDKCTASPDGPVVSCRKHDVAFASLQNFECTSDPSNMNCEADGGELDSAWNPRNKYLADSKFWRDIAQYGCEQESWIAARLVCGKTNTELADFYHWGVAEFAQRSWPITTEDVESADYGLDGVYNPGFQECTSPHVPWISNAWFETINENQKLRWSFQNGCSVTIDAIKFVIFWPVRREEIKDPVEIPGLCSSEGGGAYSCSSALPADYDGVYGETILLVMPKNLEYGPTTYGRYRVGV